MMSAKANELAERLGCELGRGDDGYPDRTSLFGAIYRRCETEESNDPDEPEPSLLEVVERCIRDQFEGLEETPSDLWESYLSMIERLLAIRERLMQPAGVTQVFPGNVIGAPTWGVSPHSST